MGGTAFSGARPAVLGDSMRRREAPEGGWSSILTLTPSDTEVPFERSRDFRVWASGQAGSPAVRIDLKS